MEAKSPTLPKIKWNRTSLIVVLWNLVPFLGVLFLGWKPVSVFICYALETIVVGIFNVLKLLIIYFKGRQIKKDGETGVSGLGIIPFFIFHYYFFVFVQLSIFFPSTGSGSVSFPFHAVAALYEFALQRSSIIALAAFIANNLFVLLNDFLIPRVYEHRSMAEQMFEPYPRIFVQQFVVILGSFFWSVFGLGMPVLVVFVFIKTLIDLVLNSNNLIDWVKEQQAKAKLGAENQNPS